MEAFNKEMLKKLSNQLMFDLNDQELNELSHEFQTYLEQIDLLDKIDTENVEPMVYPFDTATAFIREDEQTYAISSEKALSNAPNKSQDYVIVPKVVK